VFGIEDSVTFVRSKMANKKEEIEAILECADYLSEEYVTEKLLTIIGDIDKVEEVLRQKADENMSRLAQEEPEETEEEETEENPTEVVDEKE
jgi:hypothetical protein